MTIIQPPSAKPPPKKDPDHSVALWAGVAAFFGSLVAIGIIDVTDLAQWAEYVGAIMVAIVTGGAVYSKERLNDAKRERGDKV